MKMYTGVNLFNGDDNHVFTLQYKTSPEFNRLNNQYSRIAKIIDGINNENAYLIESEEKDTEINYENILENITTMSQNYKDVFESVKKIKRLSIIILNLTRKIDEVKERMEQEIVELLKQEEVL